MGNFSVKEVNQHKHPGLIFSSDATWNNQINTVSVKTCKRIGYLRRLRVTLPVFSAKENHTTFIRPLLEYRSIAGITAQRKTMN